MDAEFFLMCPTRGQRTAVARSAVMSLAPCVRQAGAGSAAPSARPPLLHADCSPRADQEADPVQDHAVVTAASTRFTSEHRWTGDIGTLVSPGPHGMDIRQC